MPSIITADSQPWCVKHELRSSAEWRKPTFMLVIEFTLDFHGDCAVGRGPTWHSKPETPGYSSKYGIIIQIHWIALQGLTIP